MKSGKKSRRILQNNSYKIVDFDAVSLYPSAMKVMYYPAGQCYKVTPEMI